MKIFIFLFFYTLIFYKSSFGQVGFIFNSNPYIYNEQNPGLAMLKQPFFLEHPYKCFIVESKFKKNILLINKLFQYEASNYLMYGYTKINNEYSNIITCIGIGEQKFIRNDLAVRFATNKLYNFITINWLLGCSYVKTNSIIQDTYKIEKYDFSDYQPTGTATASNFAVKQWIPVTGLQIDVNIWKFSLFVSVTGSKGFKAHQRLVFPYSYKGIEQPTSVTENRGTGIFREIGIKANFL